VPDPTAGRTREILETAHDAFISIDDHGRITDWNPQAEAIFGWSRDEAVGRSLAETIVPDAYRDAHRQGIERFRETGEGSVIGQRLELTALHRSGREFPVEFTISALRSEAGYWCHAFLRDITDRRRSERYMQTQHEATKVLAESGSLEDALPRLLEAVGQGMGWEVGGIWLPDDSEPAPTLRCVAFWREEATEAAEFEAATLTMRLTPGVGLPGRVWASGQSAWVPDVTVDDNFPRVSAALASGLHAAFCLPIRRGEEVMAAMEFFSAELRPPDPALLEMLDAICAQIGQFLERNLAEAEADRLKAEFFALVSHELRTPLTSIMGYLDLIVEREAAGMGKDGRGYLDVLARNTLRLDSLVADLLLLTQVEAGTFTVELGEADLAAIVRSCVEATLPAASEAGIELTLDAEDLPLCLGDPNRLEQVVNNLISNALKFTGRGGRVRIRLSQTGDGAAIEVRDTGVGIPEDEREDIFERFARGSVATAEATRGAGLGLAIAKAIVNAHGGTIDCESEVGQGTVFRLLVPLRAPDTAATADRPARAATASA
jgi:PAS domain S-box-containing protein